tara:strand:+ start:11321 stop:12016 length:696 start_codon:yes stop_codon:yes gene_type:complete
MPVTIVDQLSNSFSNAFDSVTGGIVFFIPKLLVALLVFIFGWVIGALIGRFVAQIISALRVDRAMGQLGIDKIVNRAGFQLNTGLFFGKIVEWFFIVIFLIASFEILGLTQINEFLLQSVLGYIPNVIVASVVLVIAALVSDALSKFVSGSAKAASLPSANFLGGVTKWAVWVFAIIAALGHLGIATSLLETLFTGLVYMLTIAGGLAFGLGGKEAASRFIERLRGDISGK